MSIVVPILGFVVDSFSVNSNVIKASRKLERVISLVKSLSDFFAENKIFIPILGPVHVIRMVTWNQAYQELFLLGRIRNFGHCCIFFQKRVF